MSFDKGTELCNHHHKQDTQVLSPPQDKIHPAALQTDPPSPLLTPGNCQSVLCAVVLPFLEWHRKGIIQYAAF